MNLDELRLKLTAVFEPAQEGGYTCHFDELPEVFSESETLAEAKANLLEALTQIMEYHRKEARKKTTPGVVREELQLAAFCNVSTWSAISARIDAFSFVTAVATRFGRTPST